MGIYVLKVEKYEKIYYDKDGVESYLVQITSGVAISSTREVTQGQENGEEEKNKNSKV